MRSARSRLPLDVRAARSINALSCSLGIPPMAQIDRPPHRAKRAPRPERQAAFRVGISAESRAAAFLIAKGFRILARRWRSPLGEIDIVARRRQLLVFAEVKARVNLDEAAESVNSAGELPPRRQFGLPTILTNRSAISGSMQFWWRRGKFRGISQLLSMRDYALNRSKNWSTW